MRQFFAILKDSFREAVDGFVIYAMLVLSGIVILVLASLSFTPAPPDEAFREISRHFRDAVVEGGRASQMLSQYADFGATGVRPEGDGYQLRVTADGRNRGTRGGVVLPGAGVPKAEGQVDKPPTGVDGFRELVAIWVRENRGRNEIPIFRGLSATADEQRAVTDEQMADFLKTQFAFHAGMNATVVRVPKAAAEPEYAFDVTTTGGSAVRGWPHKVGILFGAWTLPVPFNLGETLFWIQDRLVNGIGAALALLLGVVITAFFIPNMLRKGSIDLLISKPIARPLLLVYKYIGGLTFVFLVSAVTVSGVWLALAVRSGIWDPTFLVVIPILTFTFAILYAVSTFAAVFTRSPIVAILLSIGFAVFLYIVGFVKTIFDTLKTNEQTKKDLPEWAFTLVDTLNNILPRYKDLDKLTTKLLSSGTLTGAELRERALDALDYPSWGGTFGVSVAFIAVMLAISCWRFSRRDY